MDPETGACNPPRWRGRGEGLLPTFAQTAVTDPASATVQVDLSVLAYLYFRRADNLQPGPPPLRVGSPWEGLREWLPLGQQPSSLIPGPALGDTPEWLPALLPGPYLDTPGTTTWVLDFRLIQPCFENYILLSTGSQYQIYVVRDRKTNEVIYVGKTRQNLSARQSQHRSILGRENWTLELPRENLDYLEAKYWEQKLMDRYGGVEHLENKIRAVAPKEWQTIKAMFE
jgi:hypothetical protein